MPELPPCGFTARPYSAHSVIAFETSSVDAGFTSTGVEPFQRPRQSEMCGSISCASVDTPFGPSASVRRAMNSEVRVPRSSAMILS